ncbi:MAG: HAD-IA family hydrolase [Solirubrobacterales bacterium]|nr:HAD-IA family hydrolase [Solirubrobacterales bacterium]
MAASRDGTVGEADGAVVAVVFDLDGLLVDSERIWEAAREWIAREGGGSWPADAQARMMGMSTPEWTRWMHDELGVRLAPEEIRDAVLERLERVYRERVPLMRGAREAVARMAARWPLAVASSSARRLVEVALAETGLDRHFVAIVSSEEVERGKPAPDVWLEATRRLAVDPVRCVAVEDSTAGIRSAHAAGLAVVAVPEPEFPPAPEAVALAAATLDSLDELTAEVVERAALSAA